MANEIKPRTIFREPAIGTPEGHALVVGSVTFGPSNCDCPGAVGPHDTDEAMSQRIEAARAAVSDRERFPFGPSWPLFRGDPTAAELDVICEKMQRFAEQIAADPVRARAFLKHIGAIETPIP